jgi:hypothetical protein
MESENIHIIQNYFKNIKHTDSIALSDTIGIQTK